MIHPMTYAGMEAPKVGASSSAYFLDRLLMKASVIFELDKDKIMSQSRKREIVMARQAIMYVARNRTKNKLEYIAQYFGKNHATVIHACKQVENLIEFDDEYNRKVTALYRIL
jgi:chromosomal replication initiator protein